MATNNAGKPAGDESPRPWAAEAGPYVAEAVEIRRHLHQHPELGFEELDTAQLVAMRLREWGYEVTERVGRTGVVGVLRTADNGKAIGLRADMDALPIHESTGLPHRSTRAGKMHACGHDGHTAMLLGAAKSLAETRRFSGTLNLIFQPAEEGLAGARHMIEDGLFERFPCDAVFGMHNIPGLAQGKLYFTTGAMLASNDTLTITLRGRSAHGAEPHRSIDTVVAASSLVMALQTVVSRSIDPQDSAVVTVASLHAGTTHNVIAGEAVLTLTLRSHSEVVRRALVDTITRIAHAQAESFGATAEIASAPNPYPPLVNWPEETMFARGVAESMLGKDGVGTLERPLMNSEDFAFMLQSRPGSYLFIGNGTGSASCVLHNPHYDFNDLNIPVGIGYWTRLVEAFLPA